MKTAQELAEREPLALVATACHPPRSMFVFQRLGMPPFGGCDSWVAMILVDCATLLPGGEALMLSRTATREDLAWEWFAIRQTLAAGSRARRTRIALSFGPACYPPECAGA